MLTLEQARDIIDTIAQQTRLTRQEHSLVSQAIVLLYDGAKENEESKQAGTPVTEAANG